MTTYTEEKPREKTGGEIEAEHREWSQRQPARGGCLFCPEFQPEGTWSEIKTLTEEHRATVHPECRNRKRSRRPTFSGILAFSQNLTDEEREEIDANRAKRLRILGLE